MDPRLAALDRVQAGVRRDRVEPGAERAATFEAADPAPGAKHRLLKGVLGIVEGAEHPVAVSDQLAAVALDERRECSLVTGPCGVELPFRLFLSSL